MAGGIFLRRGNQLIALSEEGFAAEKELQDLLAAHPDLLSADGDAHRWLLVSQEFGIAAEQEGSDRWSVDHLFVDEEGMPTLVEVKRSTDTRIRREVVGQMLDYAANALSYWQLEKIRARFEASCLEEEPADVLRARLGQHDADAFWERVGTNLAAGRLRLIFVADVIPPELRAIVEFLNWQMTATEVLAVEVRQYVDAEGEHQTLVPRLIGDTEAARDAKGRSRRRSWDRDAWLEAFRDALGKDRAVVVEQVLEWVDRHEPALEIGFGTGATWPAALIRIQGRPTLVAITWGGESGSVSVYFANLARMPPFDGLDRRRELQRRLQEISDVVIPDRQLDKYPGFALATIASADRRRYFLEVMDWVVDEIAAASGV